MNLFIRILLTLCAFLFFIGELNAQDPTGTLSRVHGIKNGENRFYDVDAYSISEITMEGTFSPKGIKKSFKKFKLKTEEIVTSDSLIEKKNYVVQRTHKVLDDLIENQTLYFIESDKEKIKAIVFNTYRQPDSEFQREIIDLILTDQMQPPIFSELGKSRIRFGGRTIIIENRCQWQSPSNLQCPYNGQMNWSVCKHEETALEVIEIQKRLLQSKKMGKIVSSEKVNITFEGVETIATKVTYDFTGVASLALNMTGSEMLTIFYVVAPVRGHYIACVLSQWNNDNKAESGLAPLLDKMIIIN